MKDAIFHFPTEGAPVACRQIKSGHINQTYLITTDTGAKYILQWINQFVFPHVDALMSNMSAISAYLRAHCAERTPMISYLDTREGGNCYNDGAGGCWRAYRFVDNSICLQKAETPEDFAESARAFGHFQYALRDFPADTLAETIQNFHNTPDRYRQLRAAECADAAGRAAGVAEELSFAYAREARACQLHQLRAAGRLPVRATHNDTKINNVLFDADTRKAICVIDLDTVMPGLAAYDFGDAIRFGASTAAEDERDLSLVSLDLELYRAFVRGFLEACPSLTPDEVESLPLGAYTMTIECGTRFLADHINGDVYFAIDRDGHNLDRCRTQFALVRDMERHWDEMCDIVRTEWDAIKKDKAYNT